MLDQAAEQLRAVAAKPATLEVRLRAERLLRPLEDLANDPTHLRHLRAVEILERIGTREAVALLEKLARGASAARRLACTTSST